MIKENWFLKLKNMSKGVLLLLSKISGKEKELSYLITKKDYSSYKKWLKEIESFCKFNLEKGSKKLYLKQNIEFKEKERYAKFSEEEINKMKTLNKRQIHDYIITKFFLNKIRREYFISRTQSELFIMCDIMGIKLFPIYKRDILTYYSKSNIIDKKNNEIINKKSGKEEEVLLEDKITDKPQIKKNKVIKNSLYVINKYSAIFPTGFDVKFIQNKLTEIETYCNNFSVNSIDFIKYIIEVNNIFDLPKEKQCGALTNKLKLICSEDINEYQKKMETKKKYEDIVKKHEEKRKSSCLLEKQINKEVLHEKIDVKEDKNNNFSNILDKKNVNCDILNSSYYSEEEMDNKEITQKLKYLDEDSFASMVSILDTFITDNSELVNMFRELYSRQGSRLKNNVLFVNIVEQYYSSFRKVLDLVDVEEIKKQLHSKKEEQEKLLLKNALSTTSYNENEIDLITEEIKSDSYKREIFLKYLKKDKEAVIEHAIVRKSDVNGADFFIHDYIKNYILKNYSKIFSVKIGV